jgi:hypothetical protein
MEVDDSKSESEIDPGYHTVPSIFILGVSNLRPHDFGQAKRTYLMYGIHEE